MPDSSSSKPVLDAPLPAGKRALQREETRLRIVEAAAQCFSERGFEGASTRDIAARAGTNQGLITYHFRNKEALWRAAMEFLFGRARATLDREREGHDALTDPRERSRAFVRAFVRYNALHPEITRLMIEEGKTRADRMAWLVDQYLRPMYEVFVGHGRNFGGPLGEGGEGDEGELLADELLPHAFYTMVGAASVIFTVVPECERLTGLDATTDEAVERHAEFVARLLIP